MYDNPNPTSGAYFHCSKTLAFGFTTTCVLELFTLQKWMLLKATLKNW